MAERESRAVWAKRVERWKDSGLTAAQYEADTGISARRLTYWSWQLRADADRKSQPAGAPEAPKFVEVVAAPVAKKTPTGKTEPLELIIGKDGVRIRVPLHFDPAALRHLIATLEKR